jgi:hypothetical protein
MKSILTVLFLLTLFARCAAAQDASACESLKMPQLLGLSLGATTEQTQSVLGREVKLKIKKKGQRTFFQNFINDRPPAFLSGVRALYLRFFDGRLYQIEIFYDESHEAKTAADFTAILSAQMNFPVSLWQIEKGKTQINCGQISLAADRILNPHIEITDTLVAARVEELRKEKK